MKRFNSPLFIGLFLALTFSVGLFFATPVLAQTSGLAAFGEAAGFSTTATIPVIVARLIRTVISITGILAVLLIIFGGFKFMTAAGDPTKIQSAKRVITNAVIGLVIVFASFAITQFILNTLIDATGSTIRSTSSTHSYPPTYLPPSNVLYLMSLNNECSEAITNLELQFVFSKTIDASSVDAGILITDITSGSPFAGPVAGNFDVSGKNVTFTPSMVCPEDSSQGCFNDTSDFQVDLPDGVLQSTSSGDIVCSYSSYPCTFTFTTGTDIDITGPTVEMDDPDNGDPVYQDGSNRALRANTADDTGVSMVDFYVISSSNLVWTSGLPYSTATSLVGDASNNTFFTNGTPFDEWDPTGYVTNQQYKIWAVGNDCAGNNDTSEKVEIILRAANCNNAAQDASSPFNETGSCLSGEPCDCGGDDLDSIYYCGACTGDACETDFDCSSGECVDGACVDRLKITGISPGDGAVGNLVTIEGVDFGLTPGTVTFAGAGGAPIVVGAYSCDSVVQWTDSEIIVQIPVGAIDGPLSVTDAAVTPETDTTDDSYGPNMGDFDVNAIVRPGICSYYPDNAYPDDSVDVNGIRFGATRGTSEFLLGGYTPGTYLSWSDTLVDVTIPFVNAGSYRGEMQTGDFVCIDSGRTATGETCSVDSDCLTASGETCASLWCSETLDYCTIDDDCGTTGGTCESIRVSSNQVRFTVNDSSAGETPIISSVETGWQACVSPFGVIGAHCGEDDDCAVGDTCEDIGDMGPPGQYMTIYGTGFGTAVGYVWLENQDSGVLAIGDSDFPAVCENDFWHDNYITIKVPEQYQPLNPVVPVDFDTYNLSIQRQDGGESDPVDFEIINDSAGPSVCRISPSAGPEGTMTTLYGENFGSSSGEVVFHEDATSTPGTWGNDIIDFAAVVSGAQTGPVYAIESANSYTSNSVNFSVGDCREDQALCSTGESCCADGTCSTSCPANTQVVSHYAYKITTGITPAVPEVVVACTGGSVQSPSPWEGWSDPDDICVNVAVRAEFTLDINPLSLSASTVMVEECFLEDPLTGRCDPASWLRLPDASGVISTPTRAVIWDPVVDLDASTFYRVTLDGDGSLPDIQATAAEGSGYLQRDYVWEFKTRNNTDYCEVGSVLMTPNNYTTRVPGTLGYYGSLVAANDSCLSLSCNGYSLSWNSDNGAATVPAVDPPISDCSNLVTAVSETVAGIPAVISASVDQAEGNPDGQGNLIINFVDPKVKEYFPDCSEACVNALPFAEFNTSMADSFNYGGNVKLYECNDSLCHVDELRYVDETTEFVSGEDFSTLTDILQIKFDTGGVMNKNTWYRVWIDGTVASTTGVPLDEAGSNYGTDANLYFPDDFSWKFKTKNSDVICSIDSVSVSPALTNMTYIGDRAEFDAVAFGAPDDCSVQGQALQPGSYEWDAWVSTDDPNLTGVATGTASSQVDITGYMVSEGTIELADEFPTYCNSACLFDGAPITAFDSTCGNGAVERGEDCDDNGFTCPPLSTTCVDVCTSSCLHDVTDVTQCAEQCVGSGATCEIDSECDETCQNSVCGSAVATSTQGAEGDVCVYDADCVSGLRSDSGACYDFEDAGDDCSSNGACSSNYCVGSCSLSSVVCSDGDSSICPYDSGDSCETTGTGCCGDGALDAGNGEECDDGDIVGGDGCSATCQNEGSASVGGVCGDGIRDHNPAQGGEDCDYGDVTSGDGCSRFCLNEGSASSVLAIPVCGDGVIDPGEDCDDGVVAGPDGIIDGADGVMENGDGCSIRCLNEGSLSIGEICGDGVRDYDPADGGEDCDDGNTSDGDGCSSDCLNEGGSFDNAVMSICGDGLPIWDVTKGGEECDGLASATYTTGDYGVGIIATGAPVEVDPITSLAKATVSVSAGTDPTVPSTMKTGEADLQLECSCNTDSQCSTNGTLGCGVSGCCVPRPTRGTVNPAINLPADGYCRNTAVWVEFTENMDKAFFDVSVDDPSDPDGAIDGSEYDANLYLVLEEVNSVIVDDSTCPESHLVLAQLDGDQPIFVRAWTWFKRTILGLFGRSASATAITSCYVPLSYSTQRVDTDGNGVPDSMRVNLNYETLLEEDGKYRIYMKGDATDTDALHEGLLSNYGGSLCLGANCVASVYDQEFYVGDEICELEEVVTDDQGDVDAADYESASMNFFSSTNETHLFQATPYTIRTSGIHEQITELSSIYEWEWTWFSTSVADTGAEDIVELDVVADDPTAEFTSAGADGNDTVIATAAIIVDTLFFPSTAVFDATTSQWTTSESGEEAVTALLCENVWPSLTSNTLSFPYVEEVLPSYFTFYYCRDFGEDGQDDDLPALLDPIDVNSSVTSSSIQKELIFQVEDTSDAIGVRIIPNTDYLSPAAWAEAQGFTGDFTEITLDGYQAVQSGTTIYAAVANLDATNVYPNIYVISSNEDAEEESLEVFERVMETFAFNANDDEVENVGLCKYGSTFATDASSSGGYITCDSDSECYDTCESGTCSFPAEKLVCGDDKAKLTRDMRRLTDVRTLNDILDSYGEDNMHCDITKGMSCDEDSDCPGTEECVEGYPAIENGTFIPSMTNSIWGSWNSELSNALGSTLPTDPLNEFFVCPEMTCDAPSDATYDGIACGSDADCGNSIGASCQDDTYDQASCWNGETGVFMCPDDSHLYGYQSIGGEAYVLSAQLELAGEQAWVSDIDTSSSDDATIYVEYPVDQAPTSSSITLQTGFTDPAVYCDGSSWGDSEICGDGIQGVNEVCEIGDTAIELCDYDPTDSIVDDGQITTSCYLTTSSACAMQTAAEADTGGAECFPFACGNGVVDGDEDCDDGSLNGTYGFCGDDCTYTDSFYCGDGYLAASEQCDCGTTANFLTLPASSWSTSNGCSDSNGQYVSTASLSCAYNCTAPGPSCGDEVVNGTEECDGDYEEYEGMLCANGVECDVAGETCADASLCGVAYPACGTGDVCADYDDAGDECEVNSDCESGTCSSTGLCTSASDVGIECDSSSTSGTYVNDPGTCQSTSCPDLDYDMFRYRTCVDPVAANQCTWNTWEDCVGGNQQCGNGTVEGAEACDDGNNSDNDECTNECEWNVCGDDYVYVGAESCDDGNDNGEACEAGYESTCNYCNELCQYRTVSGGFCGDGELNGNEVCDGSYSTELTWFDNRVTAQTAGGCVASDYGLAGGYDATYTCRWLGVCDGGDENGELCTLDYTTYNSSGTIGSLSTLYSSEDKNLCSGGSCVPPVCAGDCDSSCPVDYQTIGVSVQSELEGAELEDSIDLYSYQNDEGASPDNGVLYVPACTVATEITANIDDQEVELPDVDIIFVTDLSGSMDNDPAGNTYCDGGSNSGTACIADSTGYSTTTCGSSIQCRGYGAPVGVRRIDYVVEATKDAIDDLFDAYGLSDSILQIGLVSYTTRYIDSWAGFCNMDSIANREVDGAWMDTDSEATATDGFMDDTGTNVNILQSLVDDYASCVCDSCHNISSYTNSSSGGTPTYRGIERAVIAMGDSTADVQIIVLLSDGNPSNNSLYDSGSTSDDCSSATSTYEGSWSGIPACVAEMAEYMSNYPDIIFYSAAVTSDTALKGYMAHLSSNECEWNDVDLESDCTGNYEFAAEDEDQITSMYATIVNSILGTNVALSTTDGYNLVTTVGEVIPGSEVTLPFPDGFSCDTSEQTIPLRHEFYGTGYMTFSDFTLTYCPYEGSLGAAVSPAEASLGPSAFAAFSTTTEAEDTSYSSSTATIMTGPYIPPSSSSSSSSCTGPYCFAVVTSTIPILFP